MIDPKFTKRITQGFSDVALPKHFSTLWMSLPEALFLAERNPPSFEHGTSYLLCPDVGVEHVMAKVVCSCSLSGACAWTRGRSTV